MKGIGRRYLPQREHMSLIRGFTVQSVEKLLLTEGEKLVLAGFSTHPEENGVYSLVQNLGMFDEIHCIYIWCDAMGDCGYRSNNSSTFDECLILGNSFKFTVACNFAY